ncbi:Uncharacterized protein Fot_11974 [Forsythia ovata]|uniref:Uncharacterized protein n=1 Tax=Forsythia ovata TaxID=205694 RepID=A0ABD1WL84_9LAMI
MKKTEISKSTRTEKKKTMVSVPEGNKHIPEEEVDDSENEDNTHLLCHSVRHSSKNNDLSSRSENVTVDIQPADRHDVSDMQNEPVANKEHNPIENEKQIIQSVADNVANTKPDTMTSKLVDLGHKLDLINERGTTIVNSSKKRKMVSQLKDFATGVVSELKSPYDDDELEHDIIFNEEDLRKIDESAVTIRYSDQH